MHIYVFLTIQMALLWIYSVLVAILKIQTAESVVTYNLKGKLEFPLHLLSNVLCRLWVSLLWESLFTSRPSALHPKEQLQP